MIKKFRNIRANLNLFCYVGQLTVTRNLLFYTKQYANAMSGLKQASFDVDSKRVNS